MDKLVVKNFGPIEEVEIDIKKVNVFIGYTSCGKSTIAKLISVVNSLAFFTISMGKDGFVSFTKLLQHYNIDFNFTESTSITYLHDSYTWIIKKNIFETDYDLGELISEIQLTSLNSLLDEMSNYRENEGLDPKARLYSMYRKSTKGTLILKEKTFVYEGGFKNILYQLATQRFNPIYIPAERIMMTMFSNSIFSMLSNDINIPECMKAFGSLYEKARKENKHLRLDFFDMDVIFSDRGDKIRHRNKQNVSIDVAKASSGLQSVIPLLSVLKNSRDKYFPQLYVIEEPELNLYPEAQTDIMLQIISSIESDSKLVITTHSPYVLSMVDNLILAKDVALMSEEKRNIVTQILPEDCLLDFESVSSYFFPKDGNIVDILDKENRLLGGEQIDTASYSIGNIYDKLLELRYHGL